MRHLLCVLYILFSAALFFTGVARAEDRPYYMATSPFFASTTSFTDWRWENMDDKDLISLHVDDFYGIPWSAFRDGTPLPPAWVDKWSSLAQTALSQRKEIYLSLSALSGRKTLADEVNGAGSRVANWATVDSSGCYNFSGEDATAYQQAYIRYCRYILDLVQPRYFSPALEISITHGFCPSQRTAFDAWYAGVHEALKKDDPRRTIFPTLQMEALYGVNEPSFACKGGETYEQCFEQRLIEELKLPMDRVAFSMYPSVWYFYGQTIAQHDPFATVQRLSSKKIWVSETGFPAVPIILESNACTTLVPDTLANEVNQESYMQWLLAEAQNRKFEMVNWWLNRDYLDGPSITACPCIGDAATCSQVTTWSGLGLEALLKLFANMALRRYDSTERPAWSLWKAALIQPRISSVPPTAESGRAYPNPFLPTEGHSHVALVDFPAGLNVGIFTVNGNRVKTLHTDDHGTALWDGRNSEGIPVASGVYFLVPETETKSRPHTIKIIIQR